jgi:hypothetical protein
MSKLRVAIFVPWRFVLQWLARKETQRAMDKGLARIAV